MVYGYPKSTKWCMNILLRIMCGNRNGYSVAQGNQHTCNQSNITSGSTLFFFLCRQFCFHDVFFFWWGNPSAKISGNGRFTRTLLKRWKFLLTEDLGINIPRHANTDWRMEGCKQGCFWVYSFRCFRIHTALRLPKISFHGNPRAS